MHRNCEQFRKIEKLERAKHRKKQDWRQQYRLQGQFANVSSQCRVATEETARTLRSVGNPADVLTMYRYTEMTHANPQDGHEKRKWKKAKSHGGNNSGKQSQQRGREDKMQRRSGW